MGTCRLAVLALLILVSACAYADEPATYEVIIVGMGSAGTTAAATLAHAGRRVLALEASDRIGGRVRTVSFGSGVVEVGAEWIHGLTGSRVYETALAHNVSVLPQDLSTALLLAGGVRDSPLALTLFEQGFTYYDEKVNHTQSKGQYVTNKLMAYIDKHHPEARSQPDLVKRVLDFLDRVANSIEGSDSWMQVNAVSDFRQLKGSQGYSWHTHGYKTFFELMLNTYKGGPGLPTLEVKLNSTVTRVQYPQQGAQSVIVTTSDGRTYHAGAAIVTVSLGVLKEKHASLFQPPLPEEKVKAIEQIAMGVVGKIIFSFDNRWWSNEYVGFLWRDEDLKNVAPEDMWTTKIVGFTPSMGCDHCIELWTCGEIAKLMETMSEEQVKAKAMALLRRFSNDTVPDPTGIIKTSWFSNELTRGTYSYTALAAAHAPDARRTLAAPLRDADGRPRVILAGEASHPTHYSTVHGASDSGHDAATLLLATLKE
ncbi:spermine oxidase-like [Pectinophora gossypiella]|uniref:spermine oxidase-like n=1 Tax=Pectinophora gossypiella TaxID=13191 RepID=UPI00214F3073|nr:spermine oxidase-like [Pectinophora gossypiella]